MGSRSDSEALSRVERALRASDDHLSEMFAIFAALEAGEAMSPAEDLAPQAERRARRPAVKPSVALTLLMGLVLIAGMLTVLFSSSPCTNSAAAGSKSARIPALQACRTGLTGDVEPKPGSGLRHPLPARRGT